MPLKTQSTCVCSIAEHLLHCAFPSHEQAHPTCTLAPSPGDCPLGLLLHCTRGTCPPFPLLPWSRGPRRSSTSKPFILTGAKKERALLSWRSPIDHYRLAQLSAPIPTRIASAWLFKIPWGQQHRSEEDKVLVT